MHTVNLSHSYESKNFFLRPTLLCNARRIRFPSLFSKPIRKLLKKRRGSTKRNRGVMKKKKKKKNLTV